MYAALSGCGVPLAFMAWPSGSAPPLPWAVYRLDEDAAMYADGERWFDASRWALELYEAAPDQGTESAVESSVRSAFGDFSKQEAWIDEENCLMTTYTFQVRS